MSRELFKILCNELTNIGKRDTIYRQCIPLEKRIAIALFALGFSAEYRTVGTLFSILKDFCRAVKNYRVRLRRKIGFPQCLGKYGCHIEIIPSTSDAVDYFNYKGWYSMALLALVDYW
ncbi:PREDICTED: uncharacterized protein LOC108976541 [Bactrocera latifrons]|uniref:uncharacterized protein LOC108976541 n=1 Tax=Bactrocera latifrons TaxID=174628 RepID=UPI0008DCAA3D|nr:PREDICTED: uncharacterized protein LOC108976541 [Bactrocera latifrons]